MRAIRNTSLGRWLPRNEELRRHPALRWLGPLLDRPWLWSANRRAVASGVAIGLLFGFLLPFGQFLVAGALAVWVRANLPVAVAATFVSNPITTPVILACAYYLGALVLGLPPGSALAAELPALERAASLGAPVLTGLAIIATSMSIAGYLFVHAAWKAVAFIRLRRQLRRAQAVPCVPGRRNPEGPRTSTRTD